MRMAKWEYNCNILKLDIRWRLVVNFTPRPLYLRRKDPHYQLDKRLGGPQGRSGHWNMEKSLATSRNRTPDIQPVARLCTDWAIPTPSRTRYSPITVGSHLLYNRSRSVLNFCGICYVEQIDLEIYRKRRPFPNFPSLRPFSQLQILKLLKTVSIKNLMFGFVTATAVKRKLCTSYFELSVLTAVFVKTSTFWIMQYSTLKVKRRFGGTCRLFLRN
jgi:hypothetical protein